MLILKAIDNGIACDCGVSDISPILQEIFYLKMVCTNTVLYLVYSIY